MWVEESDGWVDGAVRVVGSDGMDVRVDGAEESDGRVVRVDGSEGMDVRVDGSDGRVCASKRATGWTRWSTGLSVLMGGTGTMMVLFRMSVLVVSKSS